MSNAPKDDIERPGTYGPEALKWLANECDHSCGYELEHATNEEYCYVCGKEKDHE